MPHVICLLAKGALIDVGLTNRSLAALGEDPQGVKIDKIISLYRSSTSLSRERAKCPDGERAIKSVSQTMRWRRPRLQELRAGRTTECDGGGINSDKHLTFSSLLFLLVSLQIIEQIDRSTFVRGRQMRDNL